MDPKQSTCPFYRQETNVMEKCQKRMRHASPEAQRKAVSWPSGTQTHRMAELCIKIWTLAHANKTRTNYANTKKRTKENERQGAKKKLILHPEPKQWARAGQWDAYPVRLVGAPIGVFSVRTSCKCIRAHVLPMILFQKVYSPRWVRSAEQVECQVFGTVPIPLRAKHEGYKLRTVFVAQCAKFSSYAAMTWYPVVSSRWQYLAMCKNYPYATLTHPSPSAQRGR